MAQKPDLASMTLTKARAAETVPFAAAEDRPALPPPIPSQAAGEPKSLTVKLSAADYAALRSHCIRQEQETGRRPTHQEVMVQALRQLLGT